MVLFKRRKVEAVPVPSSLRFSSNAEVWEIAQTGELFTTYESYLERRDYYHQKEFTCEITGHSNLTFFEAYESETQTYRTVDNLFPEPLRLPIIKKAQFTTFGRLEHLVNWTYESFKQDFYPREHVVCVLETGDKAEGVVREKTTFPERIANGVILPATSRYLVSIEADPSAKREAMDVPIEGHNMYRDRRNFSKSLLRSFLKGALEKESWHGAPWTVKHHLAVMYGLPTEVPPHLHQRAVLAERKQMMAMQQRKEPIDQTTFFNYLASKQRPLEMRQIPIKGPGKNHRFIQQDIARYLKNGEAGLVQYQVGPPGAPGIPLQQIPSPNGMPPPPFPGLPFFGPPPPHMMPPPPPFPGHPGQPVHPGPPMQAPPIGTFTHPPPKVEVVPTPPPPPIKFPCEDTEVPPKKDVKPRPTFKFFSDDSPAGDILDEPPHPGLKITSVGTLLEIWDSLNVHAEVFILDSFTLDDFAEAMRFESPDVDCELLNEVHCSVLKQLVDEQGKVLVSLPDFEISDSEEEEEVEEPSREPSPEPQFRRTTRSSLRKEEAAALIKEKTPTPEPQDTHQAAAMLAERSWVDRLKERDFKDGGWQTILVGLLHQVSLMPRKKELCDKILTELAPMDVEPTDDTAKRQYFTALDINLRLEALQIITQLAVSSAALRKHLDDMSAEMTELRKKKIEQQRMKKDLVDEIHKLDEQRKIVVAEIQAKLPQVEIKDEAKESAEVKAPEAQAQSTNGIADSREASEDEAPPIQLRRGGDRKRKREAAEAARREKAKKEKIAQPKRTKEEIKLEKLLDEIEIKRTEILDRDEKIIEFTNDLRETDCQRSKCLGRDRFCNRYWWFERNGMPFGGVPNTSTAEYGYASGRIWVQGPDDIDRVGLIDLDRDLQASYVQVFDMTMLERKEKEEGDTHLESADHWAYIDSGAQVDQLISWFDDRGLREKALKKELVAWREIIVDCMTKMREHLDKVAADKAKKKGDDDEEPPTRVSTRTKTYVELDRSEWPCLAWRNTEALNAFGHIHSEGIVKKKGGKKNAAANAKKEKEEKALKNAKLVTRTGTSYGRK